MRPVPVLMYHHVNHHRGDTVTVTPEVFEGQMRYLAEKGYRTLKLGESIAYLRGELVLRERSVVVTFDDGWLDNYIHAYPVLQRYGINAAVFIVTGRTEKGASVGGGFRAADIPSHGVSKQLIADGKADRVAIGWDLVDEMMQSGLVEFHPHSVTHRKCGKLSGEELRREIEEPKRVMEGRLGRACPYFCWPYGSFSDEGVALAKSAGYEGIFTTRHGVVTPGSDPLAIPRIVVKDSVRWFRSRMAVYTNALLAPLYLALKKS